MAQFARPASDVSTGGWSVTPLWSKLNQSVGSGDASVVTSADNSAPDVFEVALGAISAPESGTRTLRWRRRKSATGGHNLSERVSLYQGDTLIQEWTAAVTATTLGTVAQPVTGNVTDWSDLRVRVAREGDTGGNPNNRRSLVFADIELEAPDAAPEVIVVDTDGATAVGFGGSATVSSVRDADGDTALAFGGSADTASEREAAGESSVGFGGTASVSQAVGVDVDASTSVGFGGTASVDTVRAAIAVSGLAFGGSADTDTARDADGASVVTLGGVGTISTERDASGDTAVGFGGTAAVSVVVAGEVEGLTRVGFGGFATVESVRSVEAVTTVGFGGTASADGFEEPEPAPPIEPEVDALTVVLFGGTATVSAEHNSAGDTLIGFGGPASTGHPNSGRRVLARAPLPPTYVEDYRGARGGKFRVILRVGRGRVDDYR